ncbi:MAG: diaminopimelate epimerase [Alphaproteobacteria bacterium]
MTPFVKMHGLGNDFVVIDARERAFRPDEALAAAIADRTTGVGFDQMLVMRPPEDPRADVFMSIYNADGGEVEACGNGTRCVARRVMAETGRDRVIVETVAGLLDARAAPDGLVAVDMGAVRTAWDEIPLRAACDTLHVPLALGPLADPVANNVGNPHVTFFVYDLDAIDLATLGPKLEHDPIFPRRANIGVAQVIDRGHARLRVWERGVGETRACGTGACAAAVALARRGLTEREVEVTLLGGPLHLAWRADGHIVMTGPADSAFVGAFDAAELMRR